MPLMRKRKPIRTPPSDYREDRNDVDSTQNRPLSPSELAVLRAQYEKEGEMVGVQTKFNYAWVYT